MSKIIRWVFNVADIVCLLHHCMHGRYKVGKSWNSSTLSDMLSTCLKSLQKQVFSAHNNCHMCWHMIVDCSSVTSRVNESKRNRKPDKIEFSELKIFLTLVSPFFETSARCQTSVYAHMMPNPICMYFTLLISFFCCMCVFASIREIQKSTILEIFKSIAVWEVVCLLVHVTGTDRGLNMELESAALTGRYTSFGKDSRTMADTHRCFGTGFAYKILPRPDLAFVGNPLYFKIEMDFLGRSRSSSVAKSFEWGKNVCFYCFFSYPPLQ